ncbi:hypothetical protein QCD70_07315 [Agreia sp. PsM10]|uniref:hypothetical protein n=1 Tax=Agreia sp. PsM10 TaxID=3030533 RepID=UPI00263AA524|nr:hypothetical protein [Agreia sp. PsM10]MDN4640048.1 hypothetical protein [Agreia sp. PsM10]
MTLVTEAAQSPAGRGLETFIYALGEVQAANRGCLARIWTDQTTTGLRDVYREHIAALLKDAKAHDAVRVDASVTDLDILFWSLRGIIETTGDLSRTAWRRQAAISLAGLRPSPIALADPPVAEEIIHRSRQSTLVHSERGS